jgi:iron(III) transport system substrate-binding protein
MFTPTLEEKKMTIVKNRPGSGWNRLGKEALLVGSLVLIGFVPPASAAEFDLNALIEAAKAEEPITVYASTGKIKKSAAAFTEKYGIEATGSKIKGSAQIEMVLRENQSKNVVGDVLISSDAAATLAQLVPGGMVYSWLPPDLASGIPADSQDPIVVWRDPAIWSYNSDKYETCPLDNIWSLTEPKWNRKVALSDPLNKPGYVDWFNQMETHWDQAVADAYEAHFGKKLDTSAQSATASWVQALAANAPLLTDSDSAAAEAIGTPGQAEPFVGLVSSAKYRDTVDGKLTMAICKDIQPFVGFANPSYGLIASETGSPNAAKLFLHFMMTEDGVSPMTRDGKVSGNTDVPRHAKEPSGVGALADRLTPHDAATGGDDFDKRQDWQDFWRVHYKR